MRYVCNILIDTGCTPTLVNQKLVPAKQRTAGEVLIRWAHRDEVSYHMARVNITIGIQVFAVKAGISSTLPVSVLLGTDISELVNLLHSGRQEPSGPEVEPEAAIVVTTWAQARKDAEESTSQVKRELDSGVRLKSVVSLTAVTGDDNTVTPKVEEVLGGEFDDEIFTGSREQPRLTRRQKWLQSDKYAAKGQSCEEE